MLNSEIAGEMRNQVWTKLKFEGACLWGRVISGVEGLSEAGGVSDGDWGKVGSILIVSV